MFELLYIVLDAATDAIGRRAKAWRRGPTPR
jgi:hypothetical protein